MNLNKIRRKNETEHLLLSITKNCETLIEQTHRKPEETLEFRRIKQRETFHFTQPFENKGVWKLGLTDLEVYNSIFNINTTNNKLQLYTDTFDEVSFEEVKDELEEIISVSNITDDHLEDETKGPRIIKAYWKLRSEKSSTDGYIILIKRYAISLFRDFESYLRIVIGLEEEIIRLILKQCNEKLNTYELSPGIYTIKDISEAVYPFGNHEGTIKDECDDNTLKTKLVLFRFGSTFGTLKFDERSFFSTLVCFTPYWDYKPTNAIHADSPGVYTSVYKYKK